MSENPGVLCLSPALESYVGENKELKLVEEDDFDNTNPDCVLIRYDKNLKSRQELLEKNPVVCVLDDNAPKEVLNKDVFDTFYRLCGDAPELNREILTRRVLDAIRKGITEKGDFSKAEVSESEEKIHQIYDVTMDMIEAETVDEVYEIGVNAAEKVLDFDICAIDIEDDGYLEVKAVSEGMPEEGYEEVSPEDAGIAGESYLEKESYLIDDVSEHDKAQPEDDSYRSVISVPIGESGVFQAASNEKGAFTHQDIELAELLMSKVNDALKRIEFEEELKEERDRFAALFENVPEAVVSLRFEDKTPIIQNVNPAFEEVFGYRKEEIAEKSLDELIVPREKRVEADEINRNVMEGEKERREVQRVTANEGVKDFLLQVVPYKTDDENPKAYGVYTDITERKERQRRLQVLNRVLRHNLRNEMNVILGQAELLKMDLDGEETVEKAQTIEKKAEEMTSLSDKARRIEKAVGESGDTLKNINIVDVIERNLKHFEKKYSEVDIEYETPEDGEWVKADEQLSIAVNEVIENAIEHSDKPISDTQISVGINRVNGYVEVTVEDNGPGIPEQEREVLVEGQETPLHHGSGLGLWMVNWIINGTGGQLVFDDKEPEGSVVKFKLPKSRLADAE